MNKRNNFNLLVKVTLLIFALNVITWAAPPIDQLLKEGIALRNAGKIDSSIAIFEQIIKSKSKHPEGNYNLGLSYYKKPDFEKSLKYLKNALSFGFDPIRTRAALAATYQALGDKQNAVNEYYLAIQLAPKNPELHSLLGDLYLQNRSIDLAEEEYNTALKLDSLSVPAIVGRANLLKYRRQTKEALALYEKAIAIDPRFAPTYFALGRFYSERSMYPKSIEEFSKYIQLDPFDPKGYSAIAEVFTQTKNYDSAIYNVNKAIEKGDTSVGSMKSLSYLYLRAKKPAEARDILRLIVVRAPGDVGVWIDLGKAYAQTDSYPGAVIAFRRAWDLDSASVSYFAFDLGLAYYQVAKYDSSVQMFSIKIQLDTLAAGALFNRGLAYIQLKKYKESIRDLEKGVQLRPNYALGHLWLGQVYAFLEMKTKAKAEFNTVLKLDPKNKEAKEGLANVTAPPPVQPSYDDYEEEEEYYEELYNR